MQPLTVHQTKCTESNLCRPSARAQQAMSLSPHHVRREARGARPPPHASLWAGLPAQAPYGAAAHRHLRADRAHDGQDNDRADRVRDERRRDEHQAAERGRERPGPEARRRALDGLRARGRAERARALRG